ncbi:MAG: phosphoenolpyruvate carboxykinase (ATP) [Lewinellaceae bacterium]|nr:phosphoenolpyruvate carboxykinase (ATP) [Saprospiraceae bacterium]MCB9342716.1 phosphoenolpyruvate carboxykinase (ATP) [Lewinellaceae bacterium]
MQEFGLKPSTANLEEVGLKNLKSVYWNLSPEELVEHSISKGMGHLADNGALVIYTGKFTGRSPEDRFIVKDSTTTSKVNWGKVNLPFESRKFDSLWRKACSYLKKKEVYIRDLSANASANPEYRLDLRVITEYPWSNQFANNMFLRPKREDLGGFDPKWTVLCAPGFEAVPERDGTRQGNFAIINVKKRRVLIGGTGYTGEIKKGIFSVINFVLPTRTKNALPMHCSANLGKDGDIALFFGLSGTGKTTLSADPNRMLIGDDEHAWGDKEVFNFEGGCYAKTIDLTPEKEPDIFKAIRHGAILENVKFIDGTREVDYADRSITENTRVSYPIYHIDNALNPSRADGDPKNIFFLTCDAYGILPPISRLTPEQAMYYFISGYTARVAGTEVGVKEPKSTFSACFGAPFLPLHPARYADLLGKKLHKSKANVWLVNTGWSGGPYGVGSRMKLSYTRAMITAALNGELDKVSFEKHATFGMEIPVSCPGVPSELLNPRNTWKSASEYDAKAKSLAKEFVSNFEKYADQVKPEVMAVSPKV